MSENKENAPKLGKKEEGREGNNRNRNRNRKLKEESSESNRSKEGAAKNNAEGNPESKGRNRNRNRNRNKQKTPAKNVKAAPVSEEETQLLKDQADLFNGSVERSPLHEVQLPVFEKPTIGITCGDLNGIGFELIMKTLENKEFLDLCTPVVFASSKVASYHKNALKIKDFNFYICDSIEDIKDKKANLVTTWDDNVEMNLGTPTDVSGSYALKSIDAAIEAAKAGNIDAIVTAPINKHNIAASVDGFTGHTGYLAEAFDDEVLMILASDALRVATVTGHVPVSKIAESLIEEKVTAAIELLVKSLKRDFGCIKPSIAVLGLNPHAGEFGTIGSEEVDIIKPAIDKADVKGAIVRGPFPADGFFGKGFDQKFDAVLGMYHDQVLTPFKALAMGSGTNYTSGLTVVRTSPDHGTAMHISGQNKANEASFRTSVFAAIDIVNRRKVYDEITANPIKKQKERR
ncbi:MAG TPA: 4-hydroxythreonine-4-phosphate dehydrogenase PdxA [Cryomorphaceae bacterium]|nr:4-hydroxythreonine-4-phosphate dehydrogenase PdxA [Cryomorphaceae bacterium]